MLKLMAMGVGGGIGYAGCAWDALKFSLQCTNDLWIAATASVLGAKLLTTDSDFDHLNGVFLDLEKFSR